tara:strand:- start:1293 stop:1889 length:597 start_codon:yes stop_codon:yes gene_type:complete
MQVIDNFVKDPFLIEQMQDLEGEFWTPGYYWWQNGSPSITLRHKLIDYIWLQGRVIETPTVKGFEHWIGIYESTGKLSTMEKKEQGEETFSLGHHFDKDEWLWNNKKIMSKPLTGCVYYPPITEQCEGGELKIYDTDVNDPSATFELVAPVPNRLVIFNPGQYHAVKEVTAGNRYAVAINLWEIPLSPGQMKEMNEII